MSSASTRRGMAFPLQRRTFVSLVIVGALCSIVALRSQWSWGVWRVQDVTVSLRETSMLWALVAGLVGAASAARLRPTDMIVGGCPARPLSAIQWQWLWREAAAILVGTCAGALPLLIKGWRTTTPTLFEALDVFVVALSVVALLAIAHLVAAMISHPVVWIVAPLVCLLVTTIPMTVNENALANTGRSSVTFAWSLGMIEPTGDHVVTGEAVVCRALFFLVVTASCIAVAARCMRVRTDGVGWQTVTPCLAFLLPPVLLVAAGMVRPLSLFQDAPASVTCHESRGVQVCVRDEHHDLIPLYEQAATAVLGIVPAQNRPHREALVESGLPAPAGASTTDVGTPTAFDSRDQLLQNVGANLAEKLSGRESCATSQSGLVDERAGAQRDAAVAVERTILRLAGLGYEQVASSQTTALDSANLTEFQRWYSAHQTAVQECSLLPADVGHL